MITNCGLGNPELTNLPRKLNIGLSPSRDDFPHTHINDVGLKAYPDPKTGEVRHAEMTLLSTLSCAHFVSASRPTQTPRPARCGARSQHSFTC